MKQHGVGQIVVTADDGGAAGFQQPGQMLAQTVADVVGAAGEGLAAGETAVVHGPEEGMVALLVHIGLEGAA